ncbi:MAG: hypothetical protein ABJA67_09730 [Chthonomonadales bacterium]
MRVEPETPPQIENIVESAEPSKLRIKMDKRGKRFSELTREEAIEKLKAASEKRRRLKWYGRRIVIANSVGSSVFTIAYIVYVFSTRHPNAMVTGSLLLMSFINLFGLTRASSFEHKQAAKALAEIEDINSVGVLIEAWEPLTPKYEDIERNALIEQALQTLLPQLNENNKNLIDSLQRECLYTMLGKSTFRLTMPIVKCLGKIGDEGSIRPLKKFIGRDHNNPQEYANREIAREMLAAVKARVEKQREADTLLRPSSASDRPTDRYLRPAEHAESESDSLLRPAGPE